MRILLIHGRAQGGKDPIALKQEWVDTLKSGFAAANRTWPAGVGVDFPFYGDVLDDFVAGANLPDPGDVAAKGSGQDDAFEEFMRSALIEMEDSHPSLAEANIRAEFPAEDIGEKGAQNWGWIHAIARAIDKRWTGAADFTIEKFLKDVHLYVNRRNIAKAINNIVLEMVTDEPTVVVGHSLGSVVSYRVIAESQQLDAVKHITVGSPLGLKAISSKLGIPKNLATNGWFNAFDPDDIVALNPLDGDNFPANPTIDNHDRVVNGTSNQHGITGYLNDPKVAGAIADALGA